MRLPEYGALVQFHDLLGKYEGNLKKHFEDLSPEERQTYRFFSKWLDEAEFWDLLVNPLASESGKIGELVFNGRSIRRVCEAICKRDLTVSDFREGGDYYHPWFDRVTDRLNERFDFDKFDPLILGLAKDWEKKDDPGSRFSIWDGNHRVLAYAVTILAGCQTFRPVEVIFEIEADE